MQNDANVADCGIGLNQILNSFTVITFAYVLSFGPVMGMWSMLVAPRIHIPMT